MNRGSDVVAVLVTGDGLASMRPRFMNRGSLDVQPDPQAPAQGFNEAPIHESGKCGRARERVMGKSVRFNEAPIHESGKFPIPVEPNRSDFELQ